MLVKQTLNFDFLCSISCVSFCLTTSSQFFLFASLLFCIFFSLIVSILLRQCRHNVSNVADAVILLIFLLLLHQKYPYCMSAQLFLVDTGLENTMCGFGKRSILWATKRKRMNEKERHQWKLKWKRLKAEKMTQKATKKNRRKNYERKSNNFSEGKKNNFNKIVWKSKDIPE